MEYLIAALLIFVVIKWLSIHGYILSLKERLKNGDFDAFLILIMIISVFFSITSIIKYIITCLTNTPN